MRSKMRSGWRASFPLLGLLALRVAATPAAFAQTASEEPQAPADASRDRALPDSVLPGRDLPDDDLSDQDQRDGEDPDTDLPDQELPSGGDR